MEPKKRTINPLNLPGMRARADKARTLKIPKSAFERTKPISISLNLAQIAALKVIGNGEVTRGVKRLISIHGAVEQYSDDGSDLL